MRLVGHVAIVTGAARGIGTEYARGLMREGAKVVAADILDELGEATARTLRSEGGEALFVHVDITDEESTRSLANTALETFGRIDVLVNNAALFADLQLMPLLETPLDYWNQVMAVNVTGALLCAKAVVPQMKTQGRGKIINQASDAAYRIRNVYGVSKLGIIGLTTGLARELAPHNITVNAISPGPTLTDTTIAMTGSSGRLDAMVAAIPMGRAGNPDEHVGTLVYLASDDSSWVTGQVICVDGGQVMRP